MMKQTLKTQEHVWLLNNLMPTKEAFNVYNSCLLTGSVNIKYLEAATNIILKQFSSLRFLFSYQAGSVYTDIKDSSEIETPFSSQLINEDYANDKKYSIIEEEVSTVFDLTKAPLFRIKLFSFKNNKHILAFSFHRIIVDSFSARAFSKIFGKVYTALVNNENTTNILASDNFAELAEEANAFFNSSEHTSLLEKWSTEFPDPNEKINLPIDYTDNINPDLKGITKTFSLSNKRYEISEKVADKYQKDVSKIYLAAYAILLHRISNQDSVVIGIPQRLFDKKETVIGNFENTLPIRINFSKSPCLLEIIEQIENSITLKDNYKKVPYSSLLDNSESKKDLSLNPFYQTAFNYIQTETPEYAGCETKELFIEKKGSRLDLSFKVIHNESDINVMVEYNTNIFASETINRWKKIYQVILESSLTSPELPSDEINILTTEDTHQLTEWNNTDVYFDECICVHTKFERQVASTPDAIALHWQEEKISYDELNKRANKLANYITSKIDSQDQIIGVCMNRSPEMMVSIFAILKAGATYLPIDTAAPIERTKSILEDAQPKLIFTKAESKDILPEGNSNIIEIESITSELESTSDQNPDLIIPADTQAYIIYTSGSTGNPKGVIIRHYSVLNRLSWMQNKYPIEATDILLQKTPITFDVSVWELFWWAFEGASLVLLNPGAEKEPSQLADAIEKYKATTMHFVPSMFGAFNSYLDAFKAQQKIKSLKTIFLSGEALSAEAVNEFYSIIEHDAQTKLVNLYGPTEATIDVSYFDCDKSTKNTRIYIGKPIDNTKLLMINRKNRIQPIGIQGELVIAGINLAKGYLNRPELNKEKFIEIPLLDHSGKTRVYKTGDIAKWTENGEIDYLGRIDNQVKIRGFRIELGEIEAKIMEHKDVESCAVIVNRDNPDNPLLVAYLKHISGEQISSDVIKAFLSDKIPAYMIPTTIISLLDMPLTASGKLDRKALPKSQPSKQTPKINLDNIEDTILSIWQEVLKNDNIDTSTNFFDAGGNSIMIPHIVAKLIKEQNIKVDTIDIFQYPTVETLSAFINKKMGNTSSTTKNNSSKNKKTRKTKNDHRIAIVGLAGKFPQADTIEEFWKNICDNKESIQFFTDEELEKNDATYHEHKDKPNYIRSRGILNNIEQWDPKFFGYSPHDAKYTDPQQRLWFETVWNALDDAGCDPFTYSGDIGVFAGVNLNSYLFDNILRDRKIYEDYMHFSDAETFNTYVNNDPAFIATRTAYLFNLRGPAINVQSACSTGLTAVNQACASLASGASDVAVAGASSVQTPQEIGYIFEEGSMRSADGHCRPFDENANGTVFSNAVGAVILKRLDDAIEDNDRIYGVIKGWAINNDGNDRIGFAAPSVNGQLNLIRKAQSHADINPEDISYIETHGTGTILGDPIEASALIQAFQEKTDKKQFCGLGSAKGNFGHTDEVAGMIGLIKVALAAYHKIIPATINYSAPNPNIDFANSPFFVVDKTMKWEKDKPLIMGVSAFGVGGTNSHAIIEEYKPDSPTAKSDESGSKLIVVSGKSKSALENNINNLCEFYNENKQSTSLADIAYTTQLRKTHFQNKAFVVVSKDGKIEKSEFISGSHTTQTKKKIFLFPGQGAQFVNMGLDLYNNSPLFKKHMDAGFEVFKKVTNTDLKSIIFSDTDEDDNPLNDTQYTQPALFITSYATLKLYESYGIQPDESIGHSIGEYVSACLAGVFDFETALKIVIKRGQLMQSVPEGSMMAVRTDSKTLENIKANAFEIAAINAPQSCTISFKSENQEQVETILSKNDIDFILLKTSHAFHSSQFDIILDEFENYIDQFKLSTPNVPFIACPTGDYASKLNVANGKYWAGQLRATVHYNDGIDKMQERSECVFIECGPNTHLTGLTRQNNSINKRTKIISSIGREPEGNTHEAFIASIGNIWLAGISPDFNEFYKNRSPKLVKLPQYAFDKKRYWIDIDHTKIKEGAETGLAFEDYLIEDKQAIQEETKAIDSNKELTSSQKRLLKIWAKAIGTSDIEIDDNFFAIGGHSLLAVSLVASMEKEFGVKIELRNFFENPTIEHLDNIISFENPNGSEEEEISEPEISEVSNNTTTNKKIIRGEI